MSDFDQIELSVSAPDLPLSEQLRQLADGERENVLYRKFLVRRSLVFTGFSAICVDPRHSGVRRYDRELSALLVAVDLFLGGS